MELFEAIKGRRSVYAFKPDPVSEDTLMQILDAGTWAPSHRNSQPWEFVLIGAEARKQLLEIYRQVLEAGPLQSPVLPEARKQVFRQFSQDFGGAPTLVAVLSKPPEMDIDKAEYPIAAGLAAQNIMLAAYALGIGTVWLSVGRHPKAREILQVPEGAEAVAVLVMGYPEAFPPAPPREPAADKIRRVP